MTHEPTNRQKYLRLRLQDWRNHLLQRQGVDVKEYENMSRCAGNGDIVAKEIALGIADFMDITTNVIEIIDAELSKIAREVAV